MAPPTAAATPVVTTVYPTSTYNAYPPLPQPQVYDANTKTSYYAQPPVSLNIFCVKLNCVWKQEMIWQIFFNVTDGEKQNCKDQVENWQEIFVLQFGRILLEISLLASLCTYFLHFLLGKEKYFFFINFFP